MNYYNEFHPPAAAMLRDLILDKLIPEGHVDERSIAEVAPSDLDGYTQCHFFAGIGGWAYALQLAGWPDNRPVWTGSCPCQPFSSAGKQKGKEDERHLWPVWFGLIRQSRPDVVFGEQVSAAILHHWWDDVANDLEREGYTTRAEIRPASSVGAPHKRDRLWFVANSEGTRSGGASGPSGETARGSTTGNGLQSWGTSDERGVVADTDGQQAQWGGQTGFQPEFTQHSWSGGEWINCPDRKQRLAKPSIRLLANGFPERVACLHGFGNAIVPQVAATFIKACKGVLK